MGVGATQDVHDTRRPAHDEEWRRIKYCWRDKLSPLPSPVLSASVLVVIGHRALFWHGFAPAIVMPMVDRFMKRRTQPKDLLLELPVAVLGLGDTNYDKFW